MNRFFRNLLSAELSLSQGMLEEAITDAEFTSLKDAVSQWSSVIEINLNPVVPYDVLPRAFAEVGMLGKAILEYERLSSEDPNLRGRRNIHPRYHYRLAKLYERANDFQGAEREFTRFLELWLNADQNHPNIVDARDRLASIRSDSR